MTPRKQANRFIQVLKSLRTPHDFQTRNGPVNTIDASEVRYFVPLTVTLEQFGSVTNLRELVKSGISTKKLYELAPVISFDRLDGDFLKFLTYNLKRSTTLPGAESSIPMSSGTVTNWTFSPFIWTAVST